MIVMSQTGKLHYTRSDDTWLTLCGKIVKIKLYDGVVDCKVDCKVCVRIHNRERNVKCQV